MHASDRAFEALDGLAVELPSWGFANTGTRFGKFMQAGAATTIGEKFADAGQIHRLTGCCPKVAVHVAWDFPDGPDSAAEVAALARSHGLEIGSVNPTLFEDQAYKYGSLANPDPAVRERAQDHLRDSVAVLRATGSRDLVVWLADGSNYPGQSHIRLRKRWLEEGLGRLHGLLQGHERLLVEYKPFEPAFYHTDIADWGMARLLAAKAGPRARVLVDTGHHYASQNIEQIVAWLLDEQILGGFHFNDRRYGDDDLTVGSIDPFQLFRIFCEIQSHRREADTPPEIAFMVDQSHNLKNKIEAMLQTVHMVQQTLVQASLVDYGRLAELQRTASVIDAEECLREPFQTDVRPLLRQWRCERGLPPDPLAAYRASGYGERIERERAARNRPPASAYIQAEVTPGSGR